ncbi:hypothetical protein WJR50_19500 [Catalinimonas sp. 4WD22]|uniref:hypothetical protein n=1 Tax=Catalinimonas locisalis TaxID=3133978 RepID=UPI0031012041
MLYHSLSVTRRSIGAVLLGQLHWGSSTGAAPLGQLHWGSSTGAAPLGQRTLRYTGDAEEV